MELKIKEWFFDKTQDTATHYNVFIDYARTEDGYVTVYAQEVISESEKAIQVRLSSGLVVGSYKGWKTWIPKSVIKND